MPTYKCIYLVSVPANLEKTVEKFWLDWRNWGTEPTYQSWGGKKLSMAKVMDYAYLFGSNVDSLSDTLTNEREEQEGEDEKRHDEWLIKDRELMMKDKWVTRQSVRCAWAKDG